MEVTQWLARLRLLVDVPAAYLVPDAAALPRESLRFFEVDPAWVAALVDGAFAVGRSSHVLAGHDEGLHAVAHAEAAPGISGFLLESAVVASWPRLEVRAYDGSGTELRALRTELLTLAPAAVPRRGPRGPLRVSTRPRACTWAGRAPRPGRRW